MNLFDLSKKSMVITWHVHILHQEHIPTFRQQSLMEVNYCFALNACLISIDRFALVNDWCCGPFTAINWLTLRSASIILDAKSKNDVKEPELWDFRFIFILTNMTLSSPKRTFVWPTNFHVEFNSFVRNTAYTQKYAQSTAFAKIHEVCLSHGFCAIVTFQ
jgi:hypothetical protein